MLKFHYCIIPAQGRADLWAVVHGNGHALVQYNVGIYLIS